MDIEKIQKSIEKTLENNIYIGNKDDLYNLSVRKKAASLCNATLCNLDILDKCYDSVLQDNYNEIILYKQENEQIKKICLAIYSMLSLKEFKITEVRRLPSGDKLFLFTSKLLINIINDILSLTQLINIRHTERELLLVSSILTKQLLYIFPYKG